jgi:2-polyprenyl-6-methoxyphenol hydroxylase-like FAD-dependent oxidoreductase
MPVRVAVVGAGPAGCVVALALRKAGVEVDLLERRDKEAISAGGGVVFLGGASVAACAILSLPLERVFTVGGRPITHMKLRFGGTTTAVVGWDHLAPHGAVSRACIRKELSAALLSAALDAGIKLTAGVAVQSVSEDGDGVALAVEAAGASISDVRRYDAVVACDGVNSRIRKQLLGQARGEKQLFGYTACCFTAPVPTAAADDSPAADALRAIAADHSFVIYTTPGPTGLMVALSPFDAERVTYFVVVKEAAPAVAAEVARVGGSAVKGLAPPQQKAVADALLRQWAYREYPELEVAVRHADVRPEAEYAPVTSRLAALPNPELISPGGRVILVGDAGWPM